MQGAVASVTMEALNDSIWFFNTTTYPELRVFHSITNGICDDCGLVVAGDPCVNGHTLTFVEGYEATALSTGLKAHDKCSVCSKTFIDGVEVAASELVIPSLADNWDGAFVEPTQTDDDGNIIENKWYQVVLQDNTDITEHSKVDLQPSSDQLTIFYEKDLSFVAENEDGVVTVFCIGHIPTNDYIIQCIITEVVL
jgi:hypothetical protein